MRPPAHPIVRWGMKKLVLTFLLLTATRAARADVGIGFFLG